MTTIQLTIERTDPTDPDETAELTVEVSGTVSRYRPETRLDPAEGGDAEIESITLNGSEFELTDSELDKAAEALTAQARNETEEDRDEARANYYYRQSGRDWL